MTSDSYVRVIQLLSAGDPVSVGPYDLAFYESGPAGHSFVWDDDDGARIYLSRVPNSVAKVNSGTGVYNLNAGNGRFYTWKGRSDLYDVTHLWKRNGGAVKYVDCARHAQNGETLIRQDVYLIISKGGIFCPVNMDIW